MRGWVPLDLRTVYIQYGRVIYQNLRYCHTKCVPEPDFGFFKFFWIIRGVGSYPLQNRASKIEGENYFRFHLKTTYFWYPWDIVWWNIAKFYHWDPFVLDFWPLFGKHLLLLICTAEHHVSLLIESLHISLLNFELP